jgi:hypothetical protein
VKPFLLKSALLASLVVLTCVALFLSPLPYNHELAAIINKRDLLKQGGGGRIIFVGGSGLYDGLDSRAVQNALGRRVVNVGLYGGFGISPVLREIEPLIRKDDTVVLVPEYSVLFETHREETRKWLFALSPFHSSLRLYGSGPSGAVLFLEDFFSLLRAKVLAVPKLFRLLVRPGAAAGVSPWNGYVLYGDRFDAFGDSRKPFKKVPADKIEGRGMPIGVETVNQGYQQVNGFSRTISARGGRVFFVFPAYPREEFLLNREAVKQYERSLRAGLDMQVLGRPEDFLFPLDRFTNTVNHLTAEGKQARTKTLIRLLEERLTPNR